MFQCQDQENAIRSTNLLKDSVPKIQHKDINKFTVESVPQNRGIYIKKERKKK